MGMVFGLLAAGLGVCLMFVLGWQRRQKRQVEELTEYLMRMQDYPELMPPAKCMEGKIGILQSEIYKLVVQTKEQSSVAMRDKEYLAGMLSDISHQIKTPLAAVTILTDLLKSPDLPEEKRAEFTEKIDSQVARITWLIRNLLTLSQLDANMLKLKRERVSVEALLQNACQPVAVAAEQKGIRLIVPECSEMEMVCDVRWTSEAFSNIVKNCVEHTANGGAVEILVSQNNFATNFVIRDNGEGIAKEHLPHIFERFYRGGNTSGESVGIGLAMAKQMFLMQNGVIEASSEVGVGTEFRVKMYWTEMA